MFTVSRSSLIYHSFFLLKYFTCECVCWMLVPLYGKVNAIRALSVCMDEHMESCGSIVAAM